MPAHGLALARGKGAVYESVRGTDIYAMVDVTNYSLTYKMSGFTNHMSPDDILSGFKEDHRRQVATAHRVNVIMPFYMRADSIREPAVNH